MNKVISCEVNLSGFYEYSFLSDKIVISYISNHTVHLKAASGEYNWIEIKEDQVPCYLEGSNEADIKVLSKNKLTVPFRSYYWDMNYNLSQEEIDQIVKEIKEEQNQLSLPYGGSITLAPGPYTIIDYFRPKTEANGNKCPHEMVSYVGLFETFNHCKKCGEKEK